VQKMVAAAGTAKVRRMVLCLLITPQKCRTAVFCLHMTPHKQQQPRQRCAKLLVALARQAASFMGHRSITESCTCRHMLCTQSCQLV
jgi:hypothetical protein